MMVEVFVDGRWVLFNQFIVRPSGWLDVRPAISNLINPALWRFVKPKQKTE